MAMMMHGGTLPFWPQPEQSVAGVAVYLEYLEDAVELRRIFPNYIDGVG